MTATIIKPHQGGILEGPFAEITIGECHLEIFTRPNRRAHIDTARHGKLLRQAAEAWTTDHPNPCLVALDEADEHGGPYVYGRITFSNHPRTS